MNYVPLLCFVWFRYISPIVPLGHFTDAAVMRMPLANEAALNDMGEQIT